MYNKIKNYPIFKNINENDWKEITEVLNINTKKYKKDEVIFYSGEKIHEFGIVMSGAVMIVNHDFYGNRNVMGYVESGQLFAESYAMIRTEPLLVEAVAAKDSEIMFVDMDGLEHADKEERVGSWRQVMLQNLLRMTAMKNLNLSRRNFYTSAKTIRERVVMYLSAEAVRQGSNTFEIPFDRQAMADYLGVERSALSKELGRMKKEGIIGCRKNWFEIKKEL
jgi:CRP-like cAMP-binding protein